MNEKSKEEKTESRPEDDQASEQVKAVRRSRPLLCKNCKHFIGLNADKTKYLCWRKRIYSNAVGSSKTGELCKDVNNNFNCPDYRVRFTRIIMAYFA